MSPTARFFTLGAASSTSIEVVWFEESAHNACLEEPERFQDELIDRVLASTR